MIYPQPSKKVLSCFQWPGLRASSLKGYTWGVYIKHALCSWYILFSGIYVGLLSMDSIACFPAFCRRRYIVIKSMEPAALITCCECKTIETTVYNLGGGGGNYDLQEVLCSLGCIQALFRCSLELNLFPCASATRDHIFLVWYFWDYTAGDSTIYLDSNWRLT